MKSLTLGNSIKTPSTLRTSLSLDTSSWTVTTAISCLSLALHSLQNAGHSSRWRSNGKLTTNTVPNKRRSPSDGNLSIPLSLYRGCLHMFCSCERNKLSSGSLFSSARISPLLNHVYSSAGRAEANSAPGLCGHFFSSRSNLPLMMIDRSAFLLKNDSPGA